MKEVTTRTGMEVTIDPLDAYKGVKPDKLLAATGLLPHFATEVFLMDPESVQEAFDALMECYQMGWGQDGSGWGTVEDMVYKSKYDEDPDMSPMVAFKLSDSIEFLVFQYGVCAVVDSTAPEETLMMRMD